MRAEHDNATVWAIVAHYGEAEATRRCLSCLRAGERRPQGIVVVDNQGGFAAEDAHVLAPGHNVGFAGAAALGGRFARERGAQWLWFVNNDAEAAPACLNELLRAAAGEPRAGFISPVIEYKSGEGIWFAGGSVDGRSLAVRHDGVVPATGRPFSTGFVTGCALLVSAAVVDECGLPDERLFMYLEDVDWLLRASAVGWRALVAPAARVRHDVARRNGRRVFSPAATYFLVRNRIVLGHRYGSPVWATAGALQWGLRQVAKARDRAEFAARSRALATGLRDGLAGRLGPMDRTLEGRLR